MNTKIYKGFLGVLGVFGGLALTGCSDFLEIEPQNEIILEKFWNEKADVDAIIAGCYSGMQSENVIKRMMVWGEFRSDNIGPGSNVSSDGSLEKILKEVDRYCMPSIRDTVELKVAALGDDSILYGALSMIKGKK